VSTRPTPGTDTPWLRGLAVDEPAVPADLAMRAIARVSNARVSNAAVDGSPWSFVDDVLAMARRACLVGGSCAAGLALVTGVVHAADADADAIATSVAAVDSVNGAEVGNPLMSWWQGWDTAVTSTTTSSSALLTATP
jgi:hypothetical protein